MIRKVLSLDIDKTHRNNIGCNPLMNTIRYNHKKTIEILLEDGENINQL